MPQVPTYNPGRVQEQATPNFRVATDAPIEAFGGGQSRVTDAVGGLADMGAKLALQEKSKQDDVRTQDAYAKAVRKKNELFWDPKNGAVTRRGRDAAGVSEEFNPLFNKELDAIEESLSNSDQKAVFSRIRAQQMTEFSDNLMKHSFGESEKFAEETNKSVLENNQNDTVLNWSQPGKIQSGLSLQRDTIADYAQKHGKSAEWLKENVEKEESKLHGQVINQMLSMKLDMKAKDYFDANKDAFKNPDDKAKAEAAVREGYTRGESQRQATELYRGGNLSAALSAARKISDPDVQKATVDEIKVRHNENLTIKKENEEKRYLDASNYIDKNKELPPPQVWSQLPPGEKSSLKTYLNGILQGKEVVTNMTHYQDLKLMSASPATRDAFLQVSLVKDYQNSIGRTELKELIDLQTKIKSGDEKTIQELDGIQSKNDIVGDTLGAIGIPTNSKEQKDRGREARFRHMVDQEIMKRQSATGKKVTNKDVKEIADSLAVDVKVQENLWGFKSLDYLYPDGKKKSFEIEVSDVPDGDRALIEKALKAGGAPVTDDAIIHYYLRSQKGGRGN